jgi:(2Fe-2S) ferredoxin
MPKRERYVWVCTNRRADGHPKGSCAQKGSEQLRDALKTAVAQAGLHKRVRVCASGCIDLCWVGSTVAVMPDMTFLGHVTDADIPALVEALGQPYNVSEHPALRDKVVPDALFDEPRGADAPVQLGLRRPAT